MKKMNDYINTIVHILELIIAIIIVFFIVIGLYNIIDYVKEFLQSGATNSYEVFQNFLGYALSLIVGAEFIKMILHNSTEALLELILFVIARKMLIYSSTLLDLVLGTIALLIVFVIMKYLLTDSSINLDKLKHRTKVKKRYRNDLYQPAIRPKDLEDIIPADEDQ